MQLRRRAFFCLMAGFLVFPIVPVQFTSIITAIVWSLSGGVPAIAFLLVGTFLRFDSFTILSGIGDIVARVFPSLSPVGDQELAAVVMFAGNLGTAYFFKRAIRHRILKRLPLSSFLSR
jgi:hypothetical protein